MGRSLPFVLVGFDGSPDSAEALRIGTALASHCVVAMAVLRPLAHFEPTNGDEDPGVAIRALAEDYFGQLRRNQGASDIQMRTEVVVSDKDSVAKVLDDYATARGFDLLVLGRRGEGILRRSRLGRVADAAARAGSLPVLLVSAQ